MFLLGTWSIWSTNAKILFDRHPFSRRRTRVTSRARWSIFAVYLKIHWRQMVWVFTEKWQSRSSRSRFTCDTFGLSAPFLSDISDDQFIRPCARIPPINYHAWDPFTRRPPPTCLVWYFAFAFLRWIIQRCAPHWHRHFRNNRKDRCDDAEVGQTISTNTYIKLRCFVAHALCLCLCSSFSFLPMQRGGNNDRNTDGLCQLTVHQIRHARAQLERSNLYSLFAARLNWNDEHCFFL